MWSVQLFTGKSTPSRAGVEQCRQGRRSIDHDHLSARPASRSCRIVAASTPKSGRLPSNAGLSALRDTSASSLTATAPTDVASRAASRSKRATTSSGTFLKYSVLMLQYASKKLAGCQVEDYTDRGTGPGTAPGSKGAGAGRVPPPPQRCLPGPRVGPGSL